MTEARDLRHSYAGTEHLLIGILEVGGTLRSTLDAAGLNPYQARAETLRLLGMASESSIPAETVVIGRDKLARVLAVIALIVGVFALLWNLVIT